MSVSPDIVAALQQFMTQMSERMTNVEKNVELAMDQLRLVAIESRDVKEEVRRVVSKEVRAMCRDKMTTIIQEQVRSIVQEELGRLQAATSPSPSSANVAATLPNSHPSNLRTISMRMTPTTLTDTLYYTVDTSNVEEMEREKANPAVIRQDIEKEIREKGEDKY